MEKIGVDKYVQYHLIEKQTFTCGPSETGYSPSESGKRTFEVHVYFLARQVM